MKIQNSIKTVGGLPRSEAQIRSTKAEKNPKAESSEGDSAQLSAQLQAIEKSLANGEGFKANRVEEIKKAISEDRFQVNSHKVAYRLLETVRELILAKNA